MIENLLCLGFTSLYYGFLIVLFKKTFDIYARHFEYSWVLLHAMFIYDWKQPAQRLKLRERLLTGRCGRYFTYPHYTDEYKTRLNVNAPNYCKSRAIIGQRGTLPVTPLRYLNPKKVIFRTMRTMGRQFPVTWLTSGRFSAKARPGQ